MRKTVLIRTLGPLLLAPLAAPAAEPQPVPDALDTITISATRLRTVPNFDVPASVATVSLDPDNSRAEASIVESLSGIPGLAALDRQNYAQDTQLSIRGFGARSTFGVRGVRLYADGIPASMPDGQGQLSHFNATSGERVEIMRGPFSALYGNSSGGVVQLWSRRGEPGAPSRVRASWGTNDSYTLAGQLLGGTDSIGYNLGVSRFETNGYRDHSAARRDSANARVTFNFSEDRRLDVILNYLDIPEAEDPLGLTRAQFEADPRQVDAVALQYNTRKSVEQYQGGLVYEQLLAEGHTLRLMGYAGNRQVMQVLAIPPAAQNSPTHSGGVIDLDNDYNGVDARWNWQTELAGRPFELTVGGNFDNQTQLRRGFENYVGSDVGVRGRLRRHESNRVRNIDEFAQAWWQFAPRWAVLAGVRHSEVEFRSRDRYIVPPNPDDSGSVTHSDTTPVAGLMFSPTDELRLYLSAGRGFETPTFNELSYRADGAPGLALYLEPAVSRNYELGMKWRAPAGASIEAALFRADTDDELAVARNSGGRSSYQNVASARRQGFETSIDVPLPAGFTANLAYTWVDATFESSYLICSGTPCTSPNITVPAGSRIPGVARHTGYARLQWQAGEWNAALEAQGMTGIVVNDVGSEVAPGFVVAHVEAGRNWNLSGGRLRAFARLENVFDRDYIGSVIVNEGNGRFYETGLGRSYLVGAQWQWGE